MIDLVISAQRQGSTDAHGMTLGEAEQAIRTLRDNGGRSGDELTVKVNRSHRVVSVAASVDPHRDADPLDNGADSPLDAIREQLRKISYSVSLLPERLAGQVEPAQLGTLQLPEGLTYEEAVGIRGRQQGAWLNDGGPHPDDLGPDPTPPAPLIAGHGRPMTNAEVAEALSEDRPEPARQAMPGDDLPEPLGRPAGAGQVARDAAPFEPDGDPS